jgi:hypothetical protein
MGESDELRPIADFLPGLDWIHQLQPTTSKAPKPKRTSISKIEQRLIDAAAADPALQSVLFQHTIFCQTGMPYRDPGPEARTWKRSNGIATLMISAGSVIDPRINDFVDVGLPFGPKPRLILAHLNTEALRSGSSEIETERTLTRFVSHGLHLDANGHTMRVIKDQLARLSACTIRLGMVKDGQGVQVQAQIVTAFNVWLEKDHRQRVLWPSTIRLSAEYFESLQKHAVPLDETHLAALSHSAMALDVYAWLAQRLHRIDRNKPGFIPWVSVADQFGGGYDRLRAFRAVFKVALDQVLAVYRTAKVSTSAGGLTLRNSPPPVAPRLIAVRKSKSL